MERKRGAWVGMMWLEQAGIDLVGAMDTEEEAAEEEEDVMEE